VGQKDQEIGLRHAHELALGVEPGAGDQAVNMRMELQALIPGVQDGGEAVDVGSQAFVGGQLLGEGSGDSGEEQVERLLGPGAEELSAQLGRQGEGDQEIRDVDPLGQFALNPLARGISTALRTGFVIAGVEGKVSFAAGLTDKGASAQSRSAAMSDGPKGAALVGRKRRSRVQELRQETTQGPDDGGRGLHERADRLSPQRGNPWQSSSINCKASQVL